jgi:hypothetical protein
LVRWSAEAARENEPVQRFSEIMDTLVEGWTVVIPFGERTVSNSGL